MPKSWHFVSHGEMWVPMPGDAACVWLSDTHEQVNLLVVESGETAALCLLAQPCVVIAGCAMQLGDAIKIMNDRLKPQVNVDSFSLEQAVLTRQLKGSLRYTATASMVPSSPIADFFSGVTSPSKS